MRQIILFVQIACAFSFSASFAKADIFSEFRNNGIDLSVSEEFVNPDDGTYAPAAAAWLVYFEQNKAAFFSRKEGLEEVRIRPYPDSYDTSLKALYLDVNNLDFSRTQRLLVLLDRLFLIRKTYGIRLEVGIVDHAYFEEVLNYLEPKLRLLGRAVGWIMIGNNGPGNCFSYSYAKDFYLRSVYLNNDYKAAFDSFLSTRASTIELVNLLDENELRVLSNTEYAFRDMGSLVEDIAKALVADKTLLKELKEKMDFIGIHFQNGNSIHRPIGPYTARGPVSLTVGLDAESLRLLPEFVSIVRQHARIEERVWTKFSYACCGYADLGGEEKWHEASKRLLAIASEDLDRLRLSRFRGILVSGEKTEIVENGDGVFLKLGVNETLEELRQFFEANPPLFARPSP